MDTIDLLLVESDDIYHNAPAEEEEEASPISRQASYDQTDRSGSSRGGGGRRGSSGGKSGSRPKTASSGRAGSSRSLKAPLQFEYAEDGDLAEGADFMENLDEYDFMMSSPNAMMMMRGGADDEEEEDEIAVIPSRPTSAQFGDAADARHSYGAAEDDEVIDDLMGDPTPDHHQQRRHYRSGAELLPEEEEGVVLDDDNDIDDEDDLQYSGDLTSLPRHQSKKAAGRPASAKKNRSAAPTSSGGSKPNTTSTSNNTSGAGSSSPQRQQQQYISEEEEQLDDDEDEEDDEGSPTTTGNGRGKGATSTNTSRGGGGGGGSPRVPHKGMYSTDMMRPIHTVGGVSITLGEAKLYGLLDENGEFKLRPNKSGTTNGTTSTSAKRLQQAIERSRAFAVPAPKAVVAPGEEEKECTFKPRKSAEAMKAMRSKECGYDFIDKLNSEGKGGGANDFLARLGQKHEKSMSKRQTEALRQDYEARLDKLICPSCSRYQSFDEFHQGKRKCQQCQIKYVKSSVSHPKAYARKQAEAEERRRENLKHIEDVMYPPDLYRPKLNIIEGIDRPSLQQRTEMLVESQSSQARARLDAEIARRRAEKEEAERKAQRKRDSLSHAINMNKMSSSTRGGTKSSSNAATTPATTTITTPVVVAIAPPKTAKPTSANPIRPKSATTSTNTTSASNSASNNNHSSNASSNSNSKSTTTTTSSTKVKPSVVSEKFQKLISYNNNADEK